MKKNINLKDESIFYLLINYTTKRIMEFMNEKEQQNLEIIMVRMDMEH